MTQNRMEIEERLRDSRRRPVSLVPVGQCHYCNEPVRGQETFCGPECRDDYQYEKSVRDKTRT